jgi:hypothetical protein
MERRFFVMFRNRSGCLGDGRSFRDFKREDLLAATLTLGTQIETKTSPRCDDKREKGNGKLKRQLFHDLTPLKSVVRTGRAIKTRTP